MPTSMPSNGAMPYSIGTSREGGALLAVDEQRDVPHVLARRGEVGDDLASHRSRGDRPTRGACDRGRRCARTPARRRARRRRSPSPGRRGRTGSPGRPATKSIDAVMRIARNQISCTDRQRSRVGVPGTIVTGSPKTAAHGGRTRYLMLLPSSSGYTWLAQAACSHRSASSWRRSGSSSGEVAQLGRVGRQVVQLPLLGRERRERLMQRDDLPPVAVVAAMTEVLVVLLDVRAGRGGIGEHRARSVVPTSGLTARP